MNCKNMFLDEDDLNCLLPTGRIFPKYLKIVDKTGKVRLVKSSLWGMPEVRTWGYILWRYWQKYELPIVKEKIREFIEEINEEAKKNGEV